MRREIPDYFLNQSTLKHSSTFSCSDMERDKFIREIDQDIKRKIQQNEINEAKSYELATRFITG